MKRHIITEEEYKAIKETKYYQEIASCQHLDGYSKMIEMEITFEGFEYKVYHNRKLVKVAGTLCDAVEAYNEV